MTRVSEFARDFVYPIYNGLDQSALAAWVKASTWIVPWAGAVHLLALGLLGGAILIVDMRVLGAGLTSQTPARIYRMARPLTLFALALAILSGMTLASAELMNIYYSPPYWVKMAALAAVLIFTFGVRNRLIAGAGRLPVLGWVLAVGSIAQWAGVFLYLSDSTARTAMAILLVGLMVFAWLGKRREPETTTPGLTKAASVITLAMWVTVATAGRWIAFY